MLESLPLQELDLSGTRITGAGMTSISKLDLLTYLVLDGTGVTDRSLVELSRLRKLVLLSIKDTQVTDVGLQFLTTLPELRTVLERGTPTSAAARLRLKKVLGGRGPSKSPDFAWQ